MSDTEATYVSRGGLKLQAALDAFALEVRGMICADLGCSTGGFTDCLLQRGAAHVYAVDTAYGQFAWKLRQDPRVSLCERTNALHLDPRTHFPDFPGCDLVVIDLGWTRQALALPAAIPWLRPPEQSPTLIALPSRALQARISPTPHILTLIKPHYEAGQAQVRGPRHGVLSDADAQRLTDQTLAAIPALGLRVRGCIPSPVRGLAGKRAGNQEYLALLERA